MYKGTPVIIYRQLEEDNQSYNFKEMLYITFIGMNNKKAKEFADEVSEMMARRDGEDTVKLRVNCGTGWTQSGELPKRSLDTVFTSGETKTNLVKFLTDFQDSETEMLRKGLPWHSGILLTGNPGGGKTSLIHALASDMGRSVCFLNLSSLKSDSDLMQLIGGRNNWKNSFLVIEDIDAARASVERDETDSEQVSLNTLLNALDGFLTPHGLVVIATTNHPENLDPALIRSGRFDFVAELGPLELAEANKMAELLIGQSDFFGADYVPLMGADVREKLLKHKNIV